MAKHISYTLSRIYNSNIDLGHGFGQIVWTISCLVTNMCNSFRLDA